MANIAQSLEAVDLSDADRAPEANEDAIPLLDLSPYDGLPLSSKITLLSIFFSDSSPRGAACAAGQIERLEQRVRNGEAANSPEVMSDLHRLGGSAMQAGAIRLGKTAVKHRQEQSLHSAADVAALRDCLEQSTTELRRCGLLPDTLTTHTASSTTERAPYPVDSQSTQPAASDEAQSAAARSSWQAPALAGREAGAQHTGRREDGIGGLGIEACSALGREHVLLDMSQFDGLPPAATSRLLELFHAHDSSGCGAARQLDELEEAVTSGEAADSEVIKHKLHQLAGSAMQAGAYRLGMMAKSHRAAKTLASVDDVDALRACLHEVQVELRRMGLLRGEAQS